MTPKENPNEGFRMARGNKFRTVLDSYIYLMAVLGTRFEEHTDENGAWMCLITSDNFLHDATLLARLFGLHPKHLGLTDAEMAELSSTGAVVVIEDIHRLVECNYFVDFDDAWELMDELYSIGICTTNDTQKRLNKSTPKPRKKKKRIPQIVDTDDSVEDLTQDFLIGANYD